MFDYTSSAIVKNPRVEPQDFAAPNLALSTSNPKKKNPPINERARTRVYTEKPLIWRGKDRKLNLTLLR